MSEQQAGQQSQTVAEALVAAVRRSARYNPDVESAPHCILWTDRESYCQFWCMSTEGQAALRSAMDDSSVLDGSVCSTPSMN